MQEKRKEIPRTAGGSAYRFLDFQLNPSERQLYRERDVIPLPPKTFDVLLILIRNAGSLVLREQIIREVWPDTFVTDANLTNIIVALRKALGKDAIQTVSKFGY